MKEKNSKAIACIVLIAILFGLFPPFFKLILNHIPLIIASLLIFIIIVVGVYLSSNHSQGNKYRADMISIDYYAYQSKISYWNPTFKVVLSIVLALLSISTNSIIIPIIITISMLWLTVFKGGIDLEYYFKLLLVPIGFLVLSCIAIGFNLSRKPIGDYNIKILIFYITLTKYGIHHVALIAVKALGSISCMYMMCLSTPSHEVIGVLNKMKVSPILTELMNITYRYIFILMDVQNRMHISAKSRLGYCDMKTSYYSFSSIAANLLIISFKKASMYFDALEARCYDGELKFLTEEKPLQIKHLLIAIIFVVLLFIILILTRQIGGI